MGVFIGFIAIVALVMYVFADKIKRALFNRFNPMRYLLPAYQRELSSKYSPYSIPMLQTKADAGEFMAAVTIAQIYTKYATLQDDKNTTQPAYWYTKAAELDEDYQQHYFSFLEGGMLPNGDIYPDADALLETLLTVKAEQGDVKQQCALGAFYSHRPQRDPKKEKAKQWLRTAADGQSGDALFLLGKMALESAESHVTLKKQSRRKNENLFLLGLILKDTAFLIHPQ
ncbi:hypothetical protein JCM19237_2199 [Photobacterium aphoticum]|uniref:Uncharacterized protein n=1 Tax=Photobacterium aphoticum TaxID=754436 RepID=A0A090QP92_9GAMM|nr:hypothetical protein JCM19237_2199 [Photobacterium aphoticum]